jgi:hypothetical protein
MKLLIVKDPARLSSREAIVITLVVLFIWFTGYTTGAKVTSIWEKTRVVYDCIFRPAPEDSGRV